MSTLRAKGAVVGVGESELGRLPNADGVSLRVQAATRALSDAGLRPADIDGVFTTGGPGFTATDLCEKLGVRPSYVDTTLVGGASYVAYLTRAVMAIAAGLCRSVLVAYGESAWADSKRRSGLYGGQHGLVPERVEFEDVTGNFLIASYAMAARRHMHEYGTTPEQLATVAVVARQHASRNERALLRDPISVEDVLSSRPVADPFHLLDCCPVTDGGGAYVVTSVSHAADLPNRPIYILGGGEASSHNLISQMPDLTRSSAIESGRRAFKSASCTREDVDVVEIYDAFTYLPILFLEDLGFCEKGDGGAFVESGATLPGGSLPMNTHGGALAYTQPGMHGVFLVIEAVRQLRGSAGENQVEGASIALVHGNGGVLAHQATAILGNVR